jgi:hypothetical protein
MKKLILVFVFMLCSKAYSNVPNVADYDLGFKLIYAVEVLNDQILLAGYQVDTTGFFRNGIIKQFKDGKISQLPDSIERNGINSPIRIHSESKIKCDSLDYIWLTGDVVYKFKDNKWNEIVYQDNYQEIRRYNLIAIDKDNNIWITASYFVDVKTQKSEVFRIVNDNIELVYQNYSSSGIGTTGGKSHNFYANEDGSISMFERIVVVTKNNLPDTLRNQHLTITKDFEIFRIPIQFENSSGNEKRVLDNAGIYKENNNRIWYYNRIATWLDSNNNIAGCCGGLLLHEKDSWIVLNESNGLEKPFFYNSYLPINSFIKMQNDRYFIIGFGFYEMDEHLIMRKLDINQIFNKSLFIPINPLYNSQSLEDGFRGYQDIAYLSRLYPPINNPTIDKDNNIVVVFPFGILLIPLDVVSVTDNINSTEAILIYPNPATGLINLSLSGNFTEFIVFDILGNKVLEGGLNNFQIDVSTLSSGYYIIRLNSFDSKVNKYVSFIKEK